MSSFPILFLRCNISFLMLQNLIISSLLSLFANKMRCEKAVSIFCRRQESHRKCAELWFDSMHVCSWKDSSISKYQKHFVTRYLLLKYSRRRGLYFVYVVGNCWFSHGRLKLFVGIDYEIVLHNGPKLEASQKLAQLVRSLLFEAEWTLISHGICHQN